MRTCSENFQTRCCEIDKLNSSFGKLTMNCSDEKTQIKSETEPFKEEGVVCGRDSFFLEVPTARFSNANFHRKSLSFLLKPKFFIEIFIIHAFKILLKKLKFLSHVRLLLKKHVPWKAHHALTKENRSNLRPRLVHQKLENKFSCPGLILLLSKCLTVR